VKTKQELTDTINEMVKKYAADGVSVERIGSGLCENFLHDVLDVWSGEGWPIREGEGFTSVWTDELLSGSAKQDRQLIEKYWGGLPEGFSDELLEFLGVNEPNHVWLYIDGKHYDAEAPEGVTTFVELPFFQRWLEHAPANTTNSVSP
jgi:hypothetical protein